MIDPPGAERRRDRAARAATLAAAIVAFAWLGGAVVVPVLESAGHADDVWPARLVYGRTCHQMAERSFLYAGRPVALCARCSGLVAGGALGLLAAGVLAAWRRPAPPWVLAAAVAPVAVDFGLGLVGLPALPDAGRAIVGVPAGIACGWFAAHALGDAVRSIRRHRGAARAIATGT